MARFIALPVAQGDAFYLEREDFSMLIDGGKSRIDLPEIFHVVTKTDGVNLIVCTHNDEDHANGLLGFLKAGLRCGEVWLPGRWLGALADVLKPFVEVFNELVNNIVKRDGSPKVKTLDSSVSPIEAYAEQVCSPLSDAPPTKEGLLIGEDGWPEPYLKMLEQAEPWEASPPWLGPWGPEFWLRWLEDAYRRIERADIQLLWSAIDAAGRIRTIATEAFHRGIPVRWFEFNTASPSGGVPALQPINAREVTRVSRRIGPLLDWLALTVWNKESLVFWSPSTELHPGVLFTAESDLTGIGLPIELDRAIATAPHHGSEANANAYRAVATAAPNAALSITWVRSDGRYRSRPGITYLGLGSRRLCTLCRQARGLWTTKQAVRLYSRGGVWTRHRASLECSCKEA